MTEVSLSGQRVAVTGGAGFIGSHIVECLSETSDVIVFDDLSNGCRTNIPDDVRFHEMDIRSLTADHLDGVDVIFHEAANVSISRSVQNPAFDARMNILGLLSVLDAAREAGVQRVVAASSSAVYGSPNDLPVTESTETDPQSPYAASKLSGEQYCHVYQQLYDIETVCLRYFNVYGPRQRPDSPYAGVIAVFADQVLNNDPITIHGDGNQTRDFVYVDDVVTANIQAAQTDGISGRVYNVGTGERTAINDLADGIEETIGNPVSRIHDSPREGDVRHSSADTTRLQQDLGFVPKTELEIGLAATMRWHRG